MKVNAHVKSVNLQYNQSLVGWADGTNDSPTKRFMFQVFFFSWNLAKFFAKSLSIIFFSIKFQKWKERVLSALKVCKKLWKKNMYLKHQTLGRQVVCPIGRQYCSKVTMITMRNTFEIRGWRPRICKNFEIARIIYSNWKVRTIFET